MSYLKKQPNAFNSNVAATAGKGPQGRRVPTPNAPNQTPTAPSSTGADDKNSTSTVYSTPNLTNSTSSRHNDFVYSQPANTGIGEKSATTITLLVNYLKGRSDERTWDDLYSWLSLGAKGYAKDSAYSRELQTRLQRHNQVEFIADGANGKGTYRFRPPHNIRNEEQLLFALQAQPTAQGLKYSELREGWPNIATSINRLEEEGKLLVTRVKHDQLPRMVWANDPSLITKFDPEFRRIWEQTKLPDEEGVMNELIQAGIAPTNKQGVVAGPKPKAEPRRKKARRTGKTTNTHMAGILRDYSHLKP